jgi:hypothetical protein
MNQKEDKIDVKIGTEEEKLWYDVVEAQKQNIQRMEKELLVTKKIKEMAEKELEKAKETDDKNEKEV